MCKPGRKDIFKRSFTIESYQQMKDGWTVANRQILSYHSISSNVPKASIDKLRTFPTQKAKIELFSMEQIATGGETAERVCSLAST